jgi:lipoprotein-anchoring transpeptidase ErfK/SrfK
MRNQALDAAETYLEAAPGRQIVPLSQAPPCPWPATENQGPTILVDLKNQRAWLYHDGRPTRTSPITTGRRGKETPLGDFQVVDRHRDWVSNIYNRPMPFFLRLKSSDGRGGDFGLHQGDLTGRPSSAGCIRLPRDEAIAFFSACPIGTKVRISP